MLDNYAFYATGQYSISIEVTNKIEIKKNAFALSKITELSLKSNSLIIRSKCFAQCIDLGSISFTGNSASSDVDSFANCVKLTSVSIPNMNEIKEFAFSNCIALQTANLPDTKIFRANSL